MTALDPQSDFPDFIAPPSFVYKLLFSGVLTPGLTNISCAQYASLHVQLFNGDGVTPLSAHYLFHDSESNTDVDYGTLTANATATGPSWPSWTLPVLADTFRLDGSAATLQAKIIGTNHVIPKRIGSDLAVVRNFGGTLAANAVSGTVVELLGIDSNTSGGIPITNASNYNGQVMYQWSSTVSITGNIFCKYRDQAGAEQLLLMFQNFSSTLQRTMGGHPYGYVKWRFVSNAVNGASPSVLTLTIIPAGDPL